MFTNRFIKFHMKVYDTDNESLGLDDLNEREVTVRIMASQIESYFPDRQDDINVVSVWTRSGEKFCALLNIKEFEKLLNEVTNGD